MLARIQRFFAPPVFADEEKTRIAKLLNTILLALLLGIVVYGIYYFLALREEELALIYYVMTEVVVGLLGVLLPWFLMRRGYVRQAGLLFTVLIGAVLFYLAYESGGVLGYEFPSMVLLPVVAGLLLGTRAALVSGGLSILAGLGMLVAEMNGLLLTHFDPADYRALDVWVTRSFDFALAAGLLYLASRSLMGALADARRSNRELQSAHVLLEERIATEQAQRRQLVTLFEVGTTLVSTTDLQEVLDTICREVVHLLHTTSARICDWTEEQLSGTVIAAYCGPEASTRERTSGLGEICFEEGGIANWLKLSRPCTMHVSDPDLTAEKRKYLEEYEGQAVLFLPLIAQGRIFGHIEVWESRHDRVFSEEELLLAQNLTSQASIAIQNARLLRAIQGTASELGSSTAEILAVTTQQATGASEQSVAIAQTSSTITEVRAIAEQTAQRAQSVADLAQDTAEVSAAGRQTVTDAIAGVKEVKEQVEVMAGEILALSEQTQTIGQIITTVNEIAARSNMLALNAAVEAARAGLAGKGFAVVAQEVRNMAEQSQAATEQVKGILSEIRRGVNAAVMASEAGMERADAGMKLAGEAGLVIQNLADSVGSSTEAAAQIAAAAGQQLRGMEQIAQAMEHIHQVTAQSVGGARQAERAAEELNDLAGKLRGLVGQAS
jgi:methyl-accepting chemotaxis protein